MRERLYFIDWVRVLAFFLLIFFHCAMPFTVFGWEIKDTDQSVGLSRLIWWLHQWRLPLLFFVAGVGTHFSLRRRSIGSFAGERSRLPRSIRFIDGCSLYFHEGLTQSHHPASRDRAFLLLRFFHRRTTKKPSQLHLEGFVHRTGRLLISSDRSIFLPKQPPTAESQADRCRRFLQHFRN
jgi:hypothetical protein